MPVAAGGQQELLLNAGQAPLQLCHPLLAFGAWLCQRQHLGHSHTFLPIPYGSAWWAYASGSLPYLTAKTLRPHASITPKDLSRHWAQALTIAQDEAALTLYRKRSAAHTLTAQAAALA
jgi:hypothetical protein